MQFATSYQQERGEINRVRHSGQRAARKTLAKDH